MAQTAVDWFFRWFNDNPEATHKEYAKAFEKAKAMFQEQIMDAWRNGDNDSMYSPKELDKQAEEYYNDTYIPMAIFKYNGGQGALLCSKCRVIIKKGKDFTDEEKKAMKGKITLPPQYCKKCNYGADSSRMVN